MIGVQYGYHRFRIISWPRVAQPYSDDVKLWELVVLLCILREKSGEKGYINTEVDICDGGDIG